MNHVYIPDGYRSILNLYDTQAAISLLKRTFEDQLIKRVGLKRVSAPLFVDPASGLNDNLTGVERPVHFDIPATGVEAEVVQSLAKWKRQALARYDFYPGNGLYTDMNAIRRDEHLDNLHSVYVDQWDWEKVITAEERNLDTLKATVRDLVRCMTETQLTLQVKYPDLPSVISEDITFITSQELEDQYPNHTPDERENLFVREHPVTFIIGIGEKLRSGKPHDGRAPDYDDWHLNGDLLIYNPVLGSSCELSSMGIRVDAAALDRQLTLSGCDARRTLPFHRALLAGDLPLTMGGGIGQSRMSMLLLGKAHVGEVQSSLWDQQTHEVCEAAGVILL